jgi:WD40 repeat protein
MMQHREATLILLVLLLSACSTEVDQTVHPPTLILTGSPEVSSNLGSTLSLPTSTSMPAPSKTPAPSPTPAPSSTPLDRPAPQIPVLRLPPSAIARLGTGEFRYIRIYKESGIWSVNLAGQDYFFDLRTFEQMEDQISTEDLDEHFINPGMSCPSTSEDGRYMAVSGNQRDVVNVLEVSTQEVIFVFQTEPVPGGWIECFSFSPGNNYLIGFSGISGALDAPRGDNKAYLWSLDTGMEVAILEHQNVVRSAEWSPDGQFIATGTGLYSGQGEVALWDGQTGKLIQYWDGLEAEVSVVRWSMDGNYLAAGIESLEPRGLSVDERPLGALIVWNVGDKKEVIHQPVAVNGLAWLEDGKLFASSNNEIGLWDGKAGVLLEHLNTLPAIAEAYWSPDGNKVVTTFFSPVQSPIHWDLSTGEYREIPAQDIPDDWLLHTSRERHYNGTLITSQTFSTSQNSARVQIQEESIYSNQVTIVDAENGATLFTKHIGGVGIYSAGFSPDGMRFAVGVGAPMCMGCEIFTNEYENYILLIDWSTGISWQLKGHISWVTNLLWFGDSTKLMSLSQDGTVIIWNTLP